MKLVYWQLEDRAGVEYFGRLVSKGSRCAISPRGGVECLCRVTRSEGLQ